MDVIIAAYRCMCAGAKVGGSTTKLIHETALCYNFVCIDFSSSCRCGSLRDMLYVTDYHVFVDPSNGIGVCSLASIPEKEKDGN